MYAIRSYYARVEGVGQWRHEVLERALGLARERHGGDAVLLGQVRGGEAADEQVRQVARREAFESYNFV